MNERGESDKPVVPLKPAKLNYWDFRQEFIEQVEGRGLAKENGEADVMASSPAGPAKQVDRTPSRLGKGDTSPEDLPSALERVRQAAYPEARLRVMIQGKSPVR